MGKATKNLILGSEGFIGKKLCKYLEDQGEEVVRFDIKRSPEEDARHAKIDLSGIDRVYFLAWDVGGAQYLYSENSQLHQFEWNMAILLNIMPQLHAANIPFLFISSQLAEEHHTVYGVTKRLGEVWTRLIPTGLFVRQWNVYGPIEDISERSHVVSDMVNQAITKKEIRLITTGEEKRHFIHIDDVCRAWHTMLNKNLKGVFDVTSFEWIRVIDVANIIAGLTGANVVAGEKVGNTPITPIQGKIPGWSAQITLEEGLKKMVEDAKKKYEGNVS